MKIYKDGSLRSTYSGHWVYWKYAKGTKASSRQHRYSRFSRAISETQTQIAQTVTSLVSLKYTNIRDWCQRWEHFLYTWYNYQNAKNNIFWIHTHTYFVKELRQLHLHLLPLEHVVLCLLTDGRDEVELPRHWVRLLWTRHHANTATLHPIALHCIALHQQLKPLPQVTIQSQ